MEFAPIAGSGPHGTADAADAGRLLVIVPDADADEAELARRIWGMVSGRVRTVVFLGSCPGPREEPRVRRRLSALAAATRMDEVDVETRLSRPGDWTGSVKSAWRQGDIVVCPAEPRVGFSRRPLSQMLRDTLGIQVWTVSGLYPPRNGPWRVPLQILIGWVVPLITVAAFFWIQVRIERVTPDLARDVLLSFSVAVEIILIWISQVLVA